jgi:hypothetical protein
MLDPSIVVKMGIQNYAIERILKNNQYEGTSQGGIQERIARYLIWGTYKPFKEWINKEKVKNTGKRKKSLYRQIKRINRLMNWRNRITFCIQPEKSSQRVNFYGIILAIKVYSC